MKVSNKEIEAIKEKLKPEFEKSQRATYVSYALIGGLILVFIIIFINMTGTSGTMSGPRMDFGSVIFMFIMIFVVVGGLNFFYIGPAQKEYRSKVKDFINNAVFQQMFDSVSFNAESGYDKTLMRDTALIDLGNRYSSNDYLQGVYKKVKFSRADVLSQDETTDSDGDTHTTTLFRGQAYQFQFNKNTNSYVRIRDRRYFLSGKFSKGRKIDDSKKMTFEDSEFNEMFYTVSNDSHEAFYIFTPHFMNRVKKLRSLLGSEISLVIRDSILYLAVYTESDSYEISSTKEISSEYIEKCIEETQIIKYVIDELNLDSDLYKEM